MATVTLQSATRRYPGGRRRPPSVAVDALDLTVGDGEFLVLVGPSGCGKSTTLRMVAGLEPVDDGHILIGGRDVTGVPPKDRDIAMVFQNYALYPNMTVAGNMAFALRNAGVGADEARRRVEEVAAMLQLEPYLDRRPSALSGGQRQRVAMGRAIVREPAVFCMDEPLSNLDAALRVSTRTQITELQRRLGVTTLYVTHDQVEAMTMGDRVAVLRDGVLQQVAPPTELYSAPVNMFVAGFIGTPAMNLVRAGDEVVGVRPEDLRCDPAGAGAGAGAGSGAGSGEGTTTGTGRPFSTPVRGEVRSVEDLGSTVHVHVGLPADTGWVTVTADGPPTPTGGVVVEAGRGSTLRVGDTVTVTADPAHVHLFDAATGIRR
ncbi:ABC transporter ATP-binding protein [Corynebacterium bovis]|uniref:Trehalose import ATP-binding protein SugC n=3 Tax=Corynebacterium bovis TaxID=36808 RepID=A0A426Q4E1_9CORY|nr:ABC transporter ATP-binding protein [Corynebacterium bovis]RRO90988.1 sugar ABC transporter ATP-binding protein [Corynebacterium bovis]RRO96150.1 sugar ABC transporter ATP-binding protein [Corynebacterium bovis]RRO99606.1 sugar ABC transporter ATP-binding protein [Corynebacterium bovis]RRQ03341.1 sugar ABC transporter ATP-binding protein [Corynebacterium bovis]RRQ03736.1 sugar ABC transporter ATP-binding protein [Corynebacterium bovis]